ncbi:single-strand binding protein/Primosomal replication protein n [Thermoanaerobacter mathranii subsp. mathranii str. A3]|jgi:single-stranded DNA-binding protein|uniref:Single-strand binding protein/Primosomal replication protein n n=3 Tax=Thermoanaerobacter TaxID=1754 RepID=D3T7X1_THEIA|nr:MULTISPECIES: single-stranded DNA-binding protein [Thermoanaerobacter]ADD02053.1 single-strand binding protein/Primosomal replication protein n [Thermoanaerobacter italicus Ab9]ADH60549.1 single-strand binding protein/Primosomal replication protein n [Thermoanaerobacter mathranii subsp. mathranii str. A3]MBT1278307.1 single-stranded DNA-binding protein [Thermoanaerobacter sp. CM-CNRG TB177]MDP9750141.1 single-stranded DNA-binding protein [Thermoanaerobacter pentosaceus]
MAGNFLENNVVVVVGRIFTDLEYSHQLYGEKFFNFILEVPRLSETKDYLPVTISNRLFEGMNLEVGTRIKIEGQLRSYNRKSPEEGKNKLILTIFARDIMALSEEEIVKNPNEIFLDGFICKKPVYRTTPLGREITDLLIAVNRPYNKSDYIPVIAWGRNARFSEKLEIGDRIRLWGRVQSREYQKKLGDEVATKVAYEVSITRMEVVEKELQKS